MNKQALSSNSNHLQRGFTIVELMIATLVFSVVLLMATFGLVQIGRIYYKGVTESKTQATARAALDRITQSIQYGLSFNYITAVGGPHASPQRPLSQGFCIDNHSFSYVLSNMLSDNPSGSHEVRHVLVEDDNSCPQQAQDLGDNTIVTPPLGTELLSPGMRLAKLSVDSQGTNLYEITIRVVYGDNDSLCSPHYSDCEESGTSQHLGEDDLTCKSHVGSQFCAVSELKTVVQKRLSSL